MCSNQPLGYFVFANLSGLSVQLFDCFKTVWCAQPVCQDRFPNTSSAALHICCFSVRVGDPALLELGEAGLAGGLCGVGLWGELIDFKQVCTDINQVSN